MSLIKCPKCKKEISDLATSCPYCGLIIKRNQEKENKFVERQIDDTEGGKQYKQSKNNYEKIPFYKRNWFIVIMCIIFAPIGIALLWIQKKPKNKIARIIITILLCIWFLLVVGDDEKHTSKEVTEEGETVWEKEPTALNEFEYYVNGDEIHITKHVGDSQKLNISSNYEGKKVVGFEGAPFMGSDAISAIIPEGTKSMENNTFNSCDIEYLYLPSTLDDIEDGFWSYFHGVKELYYGGNQEQWDSICSEFRKNLDVQEIYCNVNIENLGTDKAKETPIIMKEPSVGENTEEDVYEENTADVEKTNNEKSEQEDTEVEEQESEITEIPKQENEFIGDDAINRLLTEYNQIAEFKIDADNVGNGAYYENVITSCNGVWIMIYDSKDVFVDLSIEDLDDSHIYPVFRDFMKTLDSEVTDDDAYSGWRDLLTGKYIGYKYRNIGNVQCSCWIKKSSNGEVSYTVKTGCKTYKN